MPLDLNVNSVSIQLFSSPKGLDFVRNTLRPFLPYDPHDYQLEGVCKSLDGVDVFAIMATSAGKTGFYTMFILMLRELARDPQQCKFRKVEVPGDPAIIVVCPTVGLEEDMVSKVLYRKISGA